mmetsp:Transcript_57543/g.108443  ORF Transcript_57543/g.108443 Transcript_57543/m.108443 type:complete len:163 (+) Transcript_57543:77-565(+)
MRTTAFVLICLACAGLGKRLQKTDDATLDSARQQTVRKYMTGRIEAFQGEDKPAGVAQVLECFVAEGPEVTPTIDIRAPKTELAEGMDEIKKYLEGGPIIPCWFEEGSNTDPVMVDGKALVYFVLRIGTSFIGINKHLLATFEFQEKSALVTKVTVIDKPED